MDLRAYINSSMTRRSIKNLFNNITDEKIERLKFLNPYLVASAKESDTSTSMNDPKLSATLQRYRIRWMDGRRRLLPMQGRNDSESTSIQSNSPKYVIVLDSLTHMFTLFEEDKVLKFVNALSFLIRN